MKKTEVYVILEEVVENGRSFYDVDVQVLDESAPNRKTRYNQLAKARTAIEHEIKQTYHVITVQELLKTKEEKGIKKDYKNTVFPPTYTVHAIPFETFKTELDQYLKNEKNWTAPYSFSLEENEEAIEKGELYFFIDIDALGEEEIDILEKEFEDDIAFIDFLQHFLKDMFEVDDLTYEFNTLTDTLIVNIPFTEKK